MKRLNVLFMKKVSIIMPVYNGEKFLEKSITFILLSFSAIFVNSEYVLSLLPSFTKIIS